VADDLVAVDRLILDELSSKVPLIRTITEHIIQSGGKRLRPLLVLLSARALGYSEGIEHHELAAIIEFVHTATLLHDDVVDKSSLRRGQQTANAMWGNQASVLVGDFLYSRAFQILAKRSNTPVMQVLANTTHAIAEGEVLQLMNCHNPDITEDNYMSVIHRKTAHLFESAAEIGAILGTDDKEQQKALATYGTNIGLAFQIIDDVLDYQSSAEKMGKNVGDDLADGKATLPLIYTLKNCNDKKIENIIRSAIEKGSSDQLNTIVEAMQTCNAFDYCLEKGHAHIALATQALQIIPATPHRDALLQLAQFALERSC
jgi:octaprenyl-diphosphate synthase